MTCSLRRLLISCSLWLAGTVVLAGPGLHLIAPCDHEAHHVPDDRPDDGGPCLVCALQGHAAAPPAVASIERPSPGIDRADAPLPFHLSRSPERSRLPRSPPVA